MSEAKRLDIIEKRLIELEKQIQSQPKIFEEYLAKEMSKIIDSSSHILQRQ